MQDDHLPLPTGNNDPDPLVWRHLREKKYPILVELVKRVLMIPATSAPSERLFSHASLTIANDRANLLPENAEMLVLLHDFYKYKYDEQE